jgi:CDGSH-type Zn-finger protein
VWREAEIVPYRDGPYLVRGPFTIRDQDGNSIETSRRTVALCRCGKSRIRPFCDGTHRLIRFRAASEAERTVGDEPRQGPFSSSDGSLSSRAAGATGPKPTSPAPVDRMRKGSRNDSDGDEERQCSSIALALAGEELNEAKTSLERLEYQSSMNGASQIRAAQPMVAAACTLLENLAGNRTVGHAAKRTANEMGPCLCLVRGALASLVPTADDSEDAVRQVVARLRSAARHLDLPSQAV